jgi:hypothetical protein
MNFLSGVRQNGLLFPFIAKIFDIVIVGFYNTFFPICQANIFQIDRINSIRIAFVFIPPVRTYPFRLRRRDTPNHRANRQKQYPEKFPNPDLPGPGRKRNRKPYKRIS